MTWKEAKVLALQQVKVTHKHFTSEEWLIMKGNLIIFEDGNKMFEEEFMKDKPYLQEGWCEFE